jgi:hypothetical protein
VTALYVATGTSMTEATTPKGTRCEDTYPAIFERRLRAGDGVDVYHENFGRGGDTWQLILDRFDVIWTDGVPDLLSIECGPNDAATDVTDASQKQTATAVFMAAKHGCGLRRPDALKGSPVSYATPSALPKGGRYGERAVVKVDDDPTGGSVVIPGLGLSPTLRAGQAALADANGNSVTVWERVNDRPGVLGWHRIADHTTLPSAVQRTLAIGTAYRNATSGGDTPSTPEPKYLAARNNLSAVVATENVAVQGVPSIVEVPLYTYQRTMIVGGTMFAGTAFEVTFPPGYVPNFSADTGVVGSTALTGNVASGWHSIPSGATSSTEQHGNDLFHQIVPHPMRAVMPAAWITALAAASWFRRPTAVGV